MTQQMEELYLAAPRFDESQAYQSEDYSALTTRRTKLAEEIDFLFGPAAVKLLEEYVETVYDQIEMECRHFFEQGCLAAQATARPSTQSGAPSSTPPNAHLACANPAGPVPGVQAPAPQDILH